MSADLDRYAVRASINTNDQPILALQHLDCDRPIGGRSAELLMDWDYTLTDLVEQAGRHEALHRNSA